MSVTGYSIRIHRTDARKYRNRESPFAFIDGYLVVTDGVVKLNTMPADE